MTDKKIEDLENTIKELRSEVESLQKKLNPTVRQKVDKLSDVVVDSNPYSRLMALKKMGIVANYEEIRNVSVAIVGLGGIGSVAAEMLTRCGVGKLLLYDYDTVEIANMNRLFFRPDQAGMKKTHAAKQTLLEINPDVTIETYTYNITSVDNFDNFIIQLKEGGIDNKSNVNLVLGCVDNYEARISINQACLEINLSWMESGVSEDAVSGHIQYIVPGHSSCFQCVPPLIVASGISEKTLKREGVCAASLPTTMGITAGILVQNALKLLLNFGSVSYYLGYNALSDFFPRDMLKPNVECPNSWCIKRQSEYKEYLTKQPKQVEAKVEKKKPKHEDNEWGITLESSTDTDFINNNNNNNVKTTEGLVFEYTIEKTTINTEDQVQVDESTDLSDLMSQLKSLSNK